MTPEQLVGMLYRDLLGREPDPVGLAHHRNMLMQGESFSALANAISTSPEARQNYQRKQMLLNIDKGDAVIANQLTQQLVILDVGAQNLEGESHVYKPLLDRGVVQKVIGFEPIVEKAQYRNEAEPLADIRPVALGTGSEETLYLNNHDATSSLLPINSDVMGATHGLHEYKTVERRTIKTVRLDDVETPDRIDLMKLDIQGYELPVLQNAVRTLNKTLFVQCEVEFQEIYKGQALFGDVFNFLGRHGFAMCDIANQVRLAGRKFVDATSCAIAGRLFWGDAVFIKKSVEDGDGLIRQAMIASCVYKWPDMCFDLLSKRDEMTGDDLARLYLDELMNFSKGIP